MNFQEYQAIQAVNFSSLKMMRESPLHYHHALTAIHAESPAMALGSAVHCAVLEPGRFAIEYSPEPVFGDCRKPDNKATRDLWRAANEGKKTVGLADWDRLKAMHEAVHAHPEAHALLSRGDAEVTLQWQDPHTKLACKGRVDWLRNDAIVGLKTTKSNNFRSFQRSVEDYGYLLQWGYYYEGARRDPRIDMKSREMFEICVESLAPHDVIVYQIPNELIQDAIDENRELLNRVAECTKSGVWPGRAPGIVEFKRAKWAGYVDEEDDFELTIGGLKVAV